MAQGYRHLDHTEQQEISDSHRLATLRYNTAVPKLRCARRVAEGNLQFLLLAPEQVARDDVVEQLGRAPPALLVVDEAHCISEWGHDFRPDYLALGAAADAMGRPRVLALTATAAPPVREEIATRLGMHDPHTVVGDTDRPQLHLSVRLWHDEQAKWDAVAAEVAARHSTRDSSGIVYVTTRRHAEQFAQRLSDEGVLAGSYHGALRRAERDEVQDAFMGGELRLVVATNAFGMGIDKPDVRFVLHADDSPSVDAYHQEAGRAGRDGKPRRPSFTTAHKTWRWAPRTLPAPSTRCRATRSTR